MIGMVSVLNGLAIATILYTYHRTMHIYRRSLLLPNAPANGQGSSRFQRTAYSLSERYQTVQNIRIALVS